jgi:hypothetical protein
VRRIPAPTRSEYRRTHDYLAAGAPSSRTLACTNTSRLCIF